MKIFEEVTVDSVVDNASYYRQLLAKESVLVFKQLNLPVAIISGIPPKNIDVDRCPQMALMWSFWCTYDFMEEGREPWRHDPVGILTGQYHSFLLNHSNQNSIRGQQG